MENFKNKFSVATILNFLLFILITSIVLISFVKISYQSEKKGNDLLDQSLNKVVVTCYATEGRYPDSLEYLEKNYKVKIDRKKYNVEYNVFATNIYPEIVITEKAGNDEK